MPEDVIYGGGANIGTFSDVNSPGSAGSSLDTGDLRRKYSFGSRISELSMSQDPFFRFLSKVAKKPTDDPEFKFTEKRGSYHKRYAYVIAAENNSSSWVTTSDLGAAQSSGDQLKVRMGTDYNNSGNVQNIFGQTTGEIKIGAAGTAPKFFIPGQLVKIPTSDSAGGAVKDYMLVKVNSVDEYLSTGSGDDATGTTNNPDMVELNCTVVRLPSTAANSQYLTALANSDDQSTVTPADDVIHSELEQRRSYVVGTTFDKGSGYPETWKDQPYSTGYGQTQIWKTSMAMDNTDRATVLKYEGNEWARIWKEKLIEHKWDIEQSLLFGSQDSTYRTTQGAVDWIINNGNLFSLDTASKSQDDFLDDLSSYMDPRYNNGQAGIYFCSTDVYNWLHKLTGYFRNNLELSTNFRTDFANMGSKNILGLNANKFSTVYGDMNVVRNIHLDQTNIKLLGINMKYCSYRPLVGNGLNRDTAVYVGVQTLENSGVDRRVDQILTEAGMEWSMPECHAIWTN